MLLFINEQIGVPQGASSVHSNVKTIGNRLQVTKCSNPICRIKQDIQGRGTILANDDPSPARSCEVSCCPPA